MPWTVDVALTLHQNVTISGSSVAPESSRWHLHLHHPRLSQVYPHGACSRRRALLRHILELQSPSSGRCSAATIVALPPDRVFADSMEQLMSLLLCLTCDLFPSAPRGRTPTAKSCDVYRKEPLPLSRAPISTTAGRNMCLRLFYREQPGAVTTPVLSLLCGERTLEAGNGSSAPKLSDRPCFDFGEALQEP